MHIITPEIDIVCNPQISFQIPSALHAFVCSCSFMQFFTYVDSCNHPTMRIQNCLSPQRSFVLLLINLLLDKPPYLTFSHMRFEDEPQSSFISIWSTVKKTAFMDVTDFGCHCYQRHTTYSAPSFAPLKVFNRVNSLTVVRSNIPFPIGLRNESKDN